MSLIKLSLQSLVFSFMLSMHAHALIINSAVIVNSGQITTNLAGETFNWIEGSSLTSHGTSHRFGSEESLGNILFDFKSDSSFIAHTGSSSITGSGVVVDNSGTFLSESGSDIIFEAGSQYFSRSGSLVTNNTNVINRGSFVFDEGSVVNGTGSYTQDSGGSIIVNGVVTQSSINIQGAGYLGGSGTINGNVFAAGSNVIINSGNSPGMLTINGDLEVKDGAKIIMEIGTAGHDSLKVSGNLKLENAEIIFDFLDDFDASILDNFVLNDFFEMPVDPNSQTIPELDLSLFASASFGFMGDLGKVVALNVGTNGQIAQVPEPGSLALLGLGLIGLSVSRRRQS